jgi:hypothetical protein
MVYSLQKDGDKYEIRYLVFLNRDFSITKYFRLDLFFLGLEEPMGLEFDQKI